MSEVPHFTKNGYKKMKMPENLHQFLLERRNLSDVSHEDCKPWDPSYNCQKIVTTVAVPFKNTNKTRETVQIHHKMKKFGIIGNPKSAEAIIAKTLHPLIEEWSGQKLEKRGLMFGIRR